MRKKLIAANWKMNMTPSEAVQLVEKLRPLVQNPDVDVVYCVPAIDLVPVAEAIAGSNVLLGAENMSAEEKGAYTGEISAAMLKDVGAQYVILGHSERRGYFHETSAEVGAKVRQAILHGLTPILCCGESLEQREQGIILDFIRQQLKISFYGIPAEEAAGVVIAYEPIWAIGTGITATSSQAEEVCAGIRACMEDIYDRETAETIRILYGGSVNEDNAENLFAQPDIDGGLVGGASLREEFGKIVNYRIL